MIVAAMIVPSKSIRAATSVAQAAGVIQKEIDRMNTDLPSYRRISDFVVTFQPLPRTTTKKIRKIELPALFETMKRDAAPLPVQASDLSVAETMMMESPEFIKIVEVFTSVAKRIDRKSITPRTCFKIDLGLDSLDKLAIVSGLEEAFSASFTDEQFEKTETVAELIGLIKETAVRK
jgi:long-chain acyl-CoA synthetase